MPDKINRRILFSRLMVGEPRVEDFKLIEEPRPEPGEGELLLRNLYISIDPGSRARLSGRASYVPAKPLGEVMDAQSVSEVVLSRHPDFRVGELVAGYHGWQDYAISDGRRLSWIDSRQRPISTAIGVFGLPGLSAYIGIRKLLKVTAGETVLISSAAGAVGSIAGQIAKIDGAQVVGIAGGEKKCDFCQEVYGFDQMIDYKSEGSISEALKRACLKGAHVYFDNVGGELLNAAIANMRRFGRILICGQVAEYNLEPGQGIGLRDVSAFISNRLDMRGFVVLDHSEFFEEARRTMADWIKEKKLMVREHIVEGLENAPRAFCGLFRGENIGRSLVHLADPKE
ncbi:MAG: NADP-dependent oxidoreductase [Deltaproteobacteria bacterium]|nr:NADP-dependent oxidoreductase [Deltaproteobacteria bacterium]